MLFIQSFYFLFPLSSKPYLFCVPIQNIKWFLIVLQLGIFFSQNVDCFVIGDAKGFVAVGIGNSAAEHFVQSGAEGFQGTFLADFVDCHPSPLLHILLTFCKWGNAVPMNIFLWFVWALGDCYNFGLFFCFDGG